MSLEQLYTGRGVIHRPAGTGITKWMSGDVYTVKVTGADTAGRMGFVEAVVPPGGGPVAHVHHDREEAFYLLDGELEFLDGDRTVVADAGDFLFVPRGVRHRFRNIGTRPARMVFFFTPAGDEQLFVEVGDDPVPGEQPQPWSPERFAAIQPVIERLGLNTENLP